MASPNNVSTMALSCISLICALRVKCIVGRLSLSLCRTWKLCMYLFRYEPSCLWVLPVGDKVTALHVALTLSDVRETKSSFREFSATKRKFFKSSNKLSFLPKLEKMRWNEYTMANNLPSTGAAEMSYTRSTDPWSLVMPSGFWTTCFVWCTLGKICCMLRLQYLLCCPGYHQTTYNSASDGVVAIKSYLTPTLPCLYMDTNPLWLEILRWETQKQLYFKFWYLWFVWLLGVFYAWSSLLSVTVT